MAYSCEINDGHRIFLNHHGQETSVLSVMSSAGQHQQSSSTFSTGVWTHPPQIWRTKQAILIKLTTEQGLVQIQVQGQNLQITQQHLDEKNAQELHLSEIASMPEIEAMNPMEPLEMGNMRMSFSPMTMHMGDMTMQMGSHVSSFSRSHSETNIPKQHFCTQCGEKAEVGDRFCSSCGAKLRQ